MKEEINKKCSGCGRSDMSVTTYVHHKTQKAHYLCMICASSQNQPAQRSVESIDDELRELEKLSAQYEDLIKRMPNLGGLGKGMGNMFMNPMALFGDMQKTIAHLKTQRLEAMTAMDSQNRLEYELKQSLEDEDYKKSAELKKKLDKKK
jgi:hypothetical protein